MPIYAYRCASCGFEKDHLQKMSDPVLVTCPECNRETYEKQLTAAGFQLKGERSGKQFRLSDRVKVQLVRVDMATNKIDFRFIEGPLTDAKSASATAPAPAPPTLLAGTDPRIRV